MRFNLNHKNSLLFGYQGPQQAKNITDAARFYYEICTRFCADYDIRYESGIHTHLHGPKGAADICSWLSTKGWNVEYWQLGDDDDLGRPIAFGVHFADNCPRFIEAKLSGWRYFE